MGKLISLVFVAVLGFGLWQGLNGVMASSRLSNAIQDTLDAGQNSDPKSLQEDVVQRAARENVSVVSEDVQVKTEYVEGVGYPGEMLSQRGIVAQQKRVTITVHYDYRLLLWKRSSDVVGSRMYTQSANVVPQRNYGTP